MDQARRAALLPVERWAAVVRDAPLVSFDLVVSDPSARVLLGLRTNEPAKGTWFVPGGVVRKDEHLAEAFARITADELGVACDLDDSRLLGVHEHFYPTNFCEEPGYGTHYVVMVRALRLDAQPARLPTKQHTAYRWCAVAELMADPAVHEHVKRYFPA